MELAYSIKPKNEEKSVKGMGRDLDISFKDAVVICDAIRGMNLEKAVEYLEAVTLLKQPVPYRKFNTSVGHRKNLSGYGPGKYPKKAAHEIMLVLNNLVSNAEYKALSPETMKIKHIQAQKGVARRKRRPKGRWRVWRTQLVHIQAICEGK